ncbi:hypothetical protein [Methylorubrum aminovorans]|uniref:hypothetical protein n=1 Tax=Methylorubrum aminovorans TaxID=269069 RepID=UPI0024E1292C|nr:hypothetical protein [Methylorubrum aminovorans]
MTFRAQALTPEDDPSGNAMMVAGRDWAGDPYYAILATATEPSGRAAAAECWSRQEPTTSRASTCASNPIPAPHGSRSARPRRGEGAPTRTGPACGG